MLHLNAQYSSQTRTLAVLVVAVLVLLIAAAFAIYAAIASPSGERSVFQRISENLERGDQEPESFRFKEGVSPEQAAIINARVPETLAAIDPALPFSILPTASAKQSKFLAIDCLTAAIYYEAASESPNGQRAVAQVVLNRVRHPAYPNSVCGVVFQGSQRSTGCQFSFTCDGSLARRPSKDGWARAQTVAAIALAGYVEPSVGLATHYHTIWIVPYWSASLTKLRTIGAHIFYRWAGWNGTRAAFTNKYAGIELMPQLAVADIELAPEPQLEGGTVRATSSIPSPSPPTVAPSKPSDTGLLITPESRIRFGEKASQQKSDPANKNALIVDSNGHVVKSGNNGLIIDR